MIFILGGTIVRLLKVEINNFKKIGRAEIDFKENIQIIVGPNNIGKSSLIQGILMAYYSLKALHENGRILFENDVLTINDKSKGIRLDKFSFLLDDPSNLFNVSVGAVSQHLEMFVLHFENDEFIAISAAYVGGSFSVKVTNVSNNITKQELIEFLNKPIVLIPSFFTVTIDEERKSPARYASLLKNGNYNQLFRNILLDLKDSDEEKFQELVDVVEEVLDIKGLSVAFDEETDEFINANYSIKVERKNTKKMDVSSLGMGTLQFIQVFAQILLGKTSLILLDEPDAHLHSNLQKKIVEKLDYLSTKYDNKFVIATHSKDIINNVNLNQVLSLADNGEISNINDSESIMQLLNVLGATTEELLGVKLGKRIVLVEGEDDEEYLLELCDLLGLNSNEKFSKVKFVHLGGRDSVLSNHLMTFLDGNNTLLNEFKALAIIDRDYRILENHISESEKLVNKGFDVIAWSKKELENYFIEPNLIAKVINEKYPQENIVSETKVMEIIDQVFEEYKEDFIVQGFIKHLEYRKKEEAGIAIKELGESTIRELKKEARNLVGSEEKKDLVPGKEVIRRIRKELIVKDTPQQRKFVLDLIKNMNLKDIHEDLQKFREYIEKYTA